MDEQALTRIMKENIYGRQTPATSVNVYDEKKLNNAINEKRKATKRNQEELNKLLEQKLSNNIKKGRDIIEKLEQVGTSSKNSNYENVNHPKHYNNYDIEVIDMMEKIWGIEATIKFCQMNAFKYRMRMGTKPDNDINQDLEKENWYLKKALELKNKI